MIHPDRDNFHAHDAARRERMEWMSFVARREMELAEVDELQKMYLLVDWRTA